MRRVARREDLGLTPAEFRTLARLDTPQKIQAFVADIPQNFEIGGETYLSVQQVLRQRRAHCIEGALLAACALWIHGEPPLLLDLKSERDVDHVVTLFRRNGRWGAISKTNHVPLRHRDPVYRSLRELAMSWFHEYANKRHQKTLRSYSLPLDLRRFDAKLWVTNPHDCDAIVEALDFRRHYPLVGRRELAQLTLLDPLQRRGFEMRQHQRPTAGAGPGPGT